MKLKSRILWIVVLGVLGLCALLATSRGEGFTGLDSSTGKTPEETIFVSIASYRDLACGATVRDLFDKAQNPSRIYVGVCEQNSTNLEEACSAPDFKHATNVRKVVIPHAEAKGPTYARYLCSTLYRNETYYLQLDSHMQFVKHWDAKLVAEHKALPNPSKGVLTHYPHDTNTYTDEEQSVPILCDSKWGGEGVPMFYAAVKTKAQLDAAKGKHFPVPFTAGGFMFAPGSIVREVPFDPNLPHVFQGEEVLYAARLWTSGYDIYTPRVNIVLHKYGRKDEKRWHQDVPKWHEDQKPSMTRLKRLLGLQKPALINDPYGMGNVRTLQRYWEFSGLDPEKKTSVSKDKFC